MIDINQATITETLIMQQLICARAMYLDEIHNSHTLETNLRQRILASAQPTASSTLLKNIQLQNALKGNYGAPNGLDLLRSAILSAPMEGKSVPLSRRKVLSRAIDHVQMSTNLPAHPPSAPAVAPAPSVPSPSAAPKAQTHMDDKGNWYIREVSDVDVLCGRGGKSNHHPGNKRYRQVVGEIKNMYRNTAIKTVKTDLSRAIVDHVCAYGGRFVKKEEITGRYYLLNKAEARKKTSQALREAKELKWTQFH